MIDRPYLVCLLPLFHLEYEKSILRYTNIAQNLKLNCI